MIRPYDTRLHYGRIPANGFAAMIRPDILQPHKTTGPGQCLPNNFRRLIMQA